MIRKLSEENVDIILVGSQRNTVPRIFDNLYGYCNSIYGFLQGTKPDYAIVTLSFSDDNNYISRTVHFLSSITETITLAFVLFPITHQTSKGIKNTRHVTEQEYQMFKRRVETEFCIPVFFLGQEHLAKDMIHLLNVHLQSKHKELGRV